MKVKTIIIDDSSFFRVLLKDLCVDMDYEVIAEFPRGDTFVDEIKQGKFQEAQLLLLDINMPGKSGMDIIEDVLDTLPEITIIMISTFSDMNSVDRCLDLGASNYINKDAGGSEMKDIIRSTLEMNGVL